MRRAFVADEKGLYAPPGEPVLVEVPPFEFLMVDGRGDPNSSADYQATIAGLYAISYPIVIALKKVGHADLRVRPLEGLWWAEDMDVFDPTRPDNGAWRWTMMLRQPQELTLSVYDAARVKAARKVGRDVVERVRRERFDEGCCAQLMHHGPYRDEGASIARLHEFIASERLRPRGKHHEIYLSDPRRCDPAKMRTVLRQPVV